jgi:hypothetical protein
VRRLVSAWLFVAVLFSLALLLARLLAPGRFELELDVYILVVGAFARPSRSRRARRSRRRSTVSRRKRSAPPSSTGSSAS